MKIAGLVKTSLIDYPDLVSAIVFTQGCNFACGFCHNPELIPIKGEVSTSEEEILSFLTKRVTRLDGVVITGGEPTLQPDLVNFIQKVKKIGYKVKLDTNGSNPEMLKSLLDENLLDYVAMDIKGPLEKYRQISGYASTKIIQTSIKIILESGIGHEFRTTFVPKLHCLEDAEGIGEMVSGAALFTVQNFRPGHTLKKEFENEGSFSLPELERIKDRIKPFVQAVRVLENLS
jgi:pyruvate formate lyase activating enzyme